MNKKTHVLLVTLMAYLAGGFLNQTQAEELETANPDNYYGQSLTVGSNGDTLNGTAASTHYVSFGRNHTIHWGVDQTVLNGYGNEVSGFYSLVGGYKSKATASMSTALGSHSEATGGASIAIGNVIKAEGEASQIFGRLIKNTAFGSISFGAGKNNPENIATSENNIRNSVMIFANGDTPSITALPANEEEGFGKVGIGTKDPTEALEVNGTVLATEFIGDGEGLTYLNAEEVYGNLLRATMNGAQVFGEVENATNAVNAEIAERALMAGKVVSNSSDIMRGNGVAPTGVPGKDSYRIRTDENFGGENVDFLVIEKTDGNSNTGPDGGIAFTNVDNRGESHTALVVRGNGKVGVGTISPQAELDVVGTVKAEAANIEGQIRIGGGNPANGKVLVSDADGLATWQNLPAATVIGENNIVDSARSLALGYENEITKTEFSALGFGNSVALGSNNKILKSLKGFAIGISNTIEEESSDVYALGAVNTIGALSVDSFAIGTHNTIAESSSNNITIGQYNDVASIGTTALGSKLAVTANGAMAIGSGAAADKKLQNNIKDSLMIGFNSEIPTLFVGAATGENSTGKIGIGTTTPQADLDVVGTVKAHFVDVDGQLRIRSGEAANGKVLVSDDNGVASWTDLSELNTEVNSSIINSFDRRIDYAHRRISSVTNGISTRINSVRNQFNKTLSRTITEGKVGSVLKRFAKDGSSLKLSDDSLAAGRFTLVAGENSEATADHSTVLSGWGNKVSSTESIVGGRLSEANARNTLAIGNRNKSNAWGSTAIGGAYNIANGGCSIALGGENNFTNGFAAVAAGAYSKAQGANSIAFGSGVQATKSVSMAFGSEVVNDTPYSFAVGFKSEKPTFFVGPSDYWNGTGNVGVGTTTPQAKLDVEGTIRIAGGDPAEGKVLVSNDNGVASWADLREIDSKTNNSIKDSFNRISSVARSFDRKIHSVAKDFNNTVGEAISKGKVGSVMNRFSYDGSSLRLGKDSYAPGRFSLVTGEASSASGDKSVVLGGYANESSGENSVAGGINSDAKAMNSFAYGSWNEVDGGFATALGGAFNRAGGTGSTALGGFGNSVKGRQSITLGGVKNLAAGFADLAAGQNAVANGGNAMALGLRVEATKSVSMAFGSDVKNDTPYSFAVGFKSEKPTLFVGPAANPDTIGKVGVGTTDPQAELDVVGTVLATELVGSGTGITNLNASAVQGELTNAYIKAENVNGVVAFADKAATADLATKATLAEKAELADLAEKATLADKAIVSEKLVTANSDIIRGAGVAPLGAPGKDSFRIRTDENFGGEHVDFLVIEKTDGNSRTGPDGGIAFTNVDNRGESHTALVVRGNGKVGVGVKSPKTDFEVNGSAIVSESLTAASLSTGLVDVTTGLITSPTGELNFANENLVTTGSTTTNKLHAKETITTNGSVSAGLISMSSGLITDATGQISFADENLVTTGSVTATNLTSTGGLSTANLTAANIDSATGRIGVFNTDKLELSSLAVLKPLEKAPESKAVGTIFTHASGALCFFNGDEWEQINTKGQCVPSELAEAGTDGDVAETSSVSGTEETASPELVTKVQALAGIDYDPKKLAKKAKNKLVRKLKQARLESKKPNGEVKAEFDLDDDKFITFNDLDLLKLAIGE